MDEAQWNEQRTEAWRKAWNDLINVCDADTLNGMYCMLNGGGNLLGAILGGGPYVRENGVLVEEAEGDTPSRRLTAAETAELMTNLAAATEEGMTIERINELEAAFSSCLSHDEMHDLEFEGTELENAIYRHVVAEFEGGENDVTADDPLEDFITKSNDAEVTELASDIEARLTEGGLNYSVETAMIQQSATIGDLARAIAAQGDAPD